MATNDATSSLGVRALDADELPAWLELDATPLDDPLAVRLRDAWADGRGGPDRTFLLERGGEAVGRVAYIAEPAASSRLDFLEASVVGLWLPWADADADPDVTTLGARLVRDSIAALPASIAAVDAYANPVLAPYADERRAVFEAAGMPLFQEKLGFEWRADAPPTTPPQRRLTFRAGTEVGDDILTGVMDRTTQATLDRQDRYYAALVPPDAWGREMLAYRTEDDEPDWLVAFDPAGQPVGHALLGEFDEGRGTISHIGVVPEARGRGYVHELLAEINDHARRRGFGAVLSDCDTLNPPMHAAMERAGHHAANTAWHVWHYRVER
jgi:GNAT superfamily N-acetyltransferase